ncbi:DUF5916 domain-containing protein [Reichenbachiella versicolor]|uniref:DUF5916 domain-containing protein n=1 Tax=Reichenbachiella versicolor TaxID=1821036 RepID=UPI0013A5417E|nr:DUF5916 domain-containing protein [Reichenbachiella versicolor]
MKKLSLATFLLGFAFCALASQEPKNSYFTKRVEGEVPSIDGDFKDQAWQQVDWSVEFTGHRPNFRSIPSQATRFKILYDAKFLYVAIRAEDTQPELIAQRMSRRDGFEGDWVEINIDSYHDQRTAFSFSASASGVKGDEYVSNNGENWDSTWDPIWYLATKVDGEGWNAEFKIPLSQLRFANLPEHVWGIQLTRRLFREEERSTWQPVDPNVIGWVHHFGELRGIKGIKPQKQLEVQPYIVTQLDTYEKEEGNPFLESGQEFKVNAGIDAKFGITSDITLDLTVNPDFGQVEADPSVVNLSAFEQFFREQRPFFLESNNLFDFPTSGGPNNLFYSRRIGRSAQGSVGDDIEFESRTPPTRILSAGKLTGKNSKGFSWGFLTSLTNTVQLETRDTLGQDSKQKVEPLTLYNSGRIQQDFNQGQTVAGAMLNYMQRFDNEGNDLEKLHDNALSGGLDLIHFIFNRKYGFKLQVSGSQVNGSKEAILKTQESNVRLYQRPDNDYRNVDSTRTSLTGTSSRFQFGKKSGSWIWDVGFNHRSPGLELNDMGFLTHTDNINAWAWNRYRIQKQTNFFRQQSYDFSFEQTWDFGGNPTYTGVGTNIRLETNALWRIIINTWQDIMVVRNADLRGGPALRRPNIGGYGISIFSNNRKKFFAGFTPRVNIGEKDMFRSVRLSGRVIYRPTDAWMIEARPTYRFYQDKLQYVDVLNEETDPIYLMAQIDGHEYSASFRVNYNLTPNLTLELWAQPFISIGEYTQYKEVTDSKADKISKRFRNLGEHVQPSSDEDDVLTLVENGQQLASFDDPDFNVVNLRSNLVLRWEYIPGSTLFAVWSTNGSEDIDSRRNDFRNLSPQLFELGGSSTFLIKYTYRFVR